MSTRRRARTPLRPTRSKTCANPCLETLIENTFERMDDGCMFRRGMCTCRRRRKGTPFSRTYHHDETGGYGVRRDANRAFCSKGPVRGVEKVGCKDRSDPRRDLREGPRTGKCPHAVDLWDAIERKGQFRDL